MIKRIWNFCGGVTLNFWLLIAVSLNLAIGAYYIQFYPSLFKTLNHSLVQDWFLKYGHSQITKTWWIILLFVLSFFLGTNTFVCAAKRMGRLWPKKDQYGFRAFSVKIAPSLIHLCFIVILVAHLLSLISGYEKYIPVRLNEKIDLLYGNSVEVVSQHVDHYTTPAAFQGAIRQCTVLLKIQSREKAETKELRVLNPIYWQGMSIHLDVFTKANSQKSPTDPELKLIIKQDPGVIPIILCFAIICLLMIWYFPQRKNHGETRI